MKFGLPDNAIEAIQKVFESNPKIDEVILFGSRAKGNFRPGSDIDLVLKGRNISSDDISQLSIKLDELDLPYEIDLLNYATISDKDIIEHVDRVGVVFYERWRKCKLNELTEPVKDLYIPNGSKDYKYIGLEHIEQESLRLSSIGVSSEVNSAKYKFKSNDILFGKLRPYFRKVIQPEFDGICSTDIWVLRAKYGIDQNYLFYFIANWDFVNTADGGESGTRMPRADWNFMKTTEWMIPPINEQALIASVLRSLDDQIDLLIHQNKTIEELAKIIFRHWFVTETKVEWKTAKLSEHIIPFRGLSYKGSGLTESESGFPMHNLNSIYEGGGYKFEGIKYYNGEYKERHLLNAGDIIMANTEQGHEFRLIGFPAIVPDSFGSKGLFSQHLYRILPRPDTYLSKEFIYFLLMSPYIRDQIVSATNGSTVNMLAIDGLQSPTFKIPPKELVAQFTEIAQDYMKKQKSNHSQIANLTKIRNDLLPKLISGEIRVAMSL